MEKFDYEGLQSGTDDSFDAEGMRQVELDFISECVNPPRIEDLVDRVDDIEGGKPPKAIDHNQQVSDVIEPIRDDIPSKYLEAPSDNIQIEEISDSMRNIEGLSYEEWKELSPEDRLNVLQELESNIADIAHREECPISTKELGEGHYGYFDPNLKTITINSELFESDSFKDYKECLDTVIHEGRHAYQYYNLNEREVHPREGDLTNWKLNEFEYGYQDAETCGFKAYYMQPQEADARAFAEDILNKYIKEA